jgi:hypothetical protein
MVSSDARAKALVTRVYLVPFLSNKESCVLTRFVLMFPPYWGWLFWQYLHACALAFVEGQETDAVHLQKAARFVQMTCAFLPCPGCTMHCIDHTGKDAVPVFGTSSDFWEYLVDFHNSVNRRTEKAAMTSDEAKDALRETLSGYGLQMQIREPSAIPWYNNAFLQDFWHVLCHGTLVRLLNGDESGLLEAGAKEMQANIFEWLECATYIMPFRHRTLREQNGVTCGEAMRAALSTLHMSHPDLIFNATHGTGRLDAALSMVSAMFCVVCEEFGVLPQTPQDLRNRLNQRYAPNELESISRAHRMRLEDQKRMSELQSRLLGQSAEVTPVQTVQQSPPVGHVAPPASLARRNGTSDSDGKACPQTVDFMQPVIMLCVATFILLGVFLVYNYLLHKRLATQRTLIAGPNLVGIDGLERHEADKKLLGAE